MTGKRGHNSKKLIVCVTGMPGAGKSTAAEAIARMGFGLVNMGDVIREETSRRRMPPTEENSAAVMLELRERMGRGAVAQLCLPKINALSERYAVVDGLRSIDETTVFKGVSPVKTLVIHASPEMRFRYLTARGRADAPLTWQQFVERDRRELSVGVAEAIALSDEVVSNNDVTISELRRAASSTIKHWLKSLDG